MASNPQHVLVLHRANYDQIKDAPWFESPDETLSGTQLFNPNWRDQPSAVDRVELVYGAQTISAAFTTRLESLGIAYDIHISGMENQRPYTIHSRYGGTGAHEVKEIAFDSYNPDMTECMKHIAAGDLDALRDYITQHEADTKVIGWQSQVEFGKRYRARELLKYQ